MKTTNRKLSLSRTTLRTLGDQELRQVDGAGGPTFDWVSCTITNRCTRANVSGCKTIMEMP